MAEQQNTSMYHVPASQEAVVVRSPEIIPTEVELARQQAMESALDAREADPTDVDRRRIEGLLGESTIAAAEIAVASPELSFNPRDPKHLVAAGRQVVRMRDIERGEGTPIVSELVIHEQQRDKGNFRLAA